MPRALLIIAAVLCSAGLEQAAHAQTDPPEYNLVVVTSPTPSPAAVRLLEWMETDPALTTLRGRTHYHHFTTANPLYRQRYAERLPPSELPIVALAAVDGSLIYKASGENVPGSAADLVESMKAAHTLHRSLPTLPPNDRRQLAAAGAFGDCSDGTCPNQPTFPGIDWRPGDGFNRVLDGAIPDTVTIAPQVDAGSLGPWIAGALAVGFVCLLAFGFFSLLTAAGAFVVSRVI